MILYIYIYVTSREKNNYNYYYHRRLLNKNLQDYFSHLFPPFAPKDIKIRVMCDRRSGIATVI